MKKIIASLLAIFMLASMLVACTGNNPKDTTKDPEGTKIPLPSDQESTPVETPVETPAETDPPEVVEFEEADEVVYVVKDVEGLRLRSSLSFDDASNIKYTVAAGTELKRTGTHETWSRVEYKGETLYCSAKYLTTEDPAVSTEPNVDHIVFEEVDEKVFVDDPENKDGAAWYYSIPVLDAQYRVNTFADGTEIQRTGIYYEDPENDPEKLGWSRIVFEGNTYYMRNWVISTVAPGAATETPAETPAA